ncbi:thiamine-phosphate kinase, partial [Achromobacter sp.]|uniref:thiamine-phosphate kinase n=1 Tax=Achromobacter sp. TaxID=134375 RepID=UPI002F922B9F
MASEFDLIARYFTRAAPAGLLGVGDDCALFPVPPGEQVATSTDLLLEGRHFFPDVDPKSLGHKALAVNLSDLAAMGARPIGCVLGLALPRLDEAWLAAFAEGFHALAAAHGCPLIGGDTTRSAHDLAISVTVFGAVPAGLALRRDGAKAGDDIWVSGELGAADVAYRLLDGQYPADPALLAATRDALEWPDPQVSLGLALRGIAHAAIDISDGLLQDLGHILAASRVGATLHYAQLPVASALAPLAQAPLRRAVLGGGDVYQLCFTAPTSRR